jgi:CheY-like chemotaxis protein
VGSVAYSSLGNRPPGAALVVEDDEHVRALLCSLLRPLGFERIIEVAAIAPALSHLGCTPIALAVIDLCLSDEDGTELISAIRSHRRPEVQAIPIAAISATSTLPRIEQAIAVGADAFIAKPFSVGSVQRSVALACVKRQLTKAPKENILDTIRLFDRQESVLEID